ncbi:MAG: DEAD/DEAH box helicase family protein, partial [Bacteroidota bacterium]
MSQNNNEDTRVKIPAILHLCRLGYEYISLKQTKWDPAFNIFPDIFSQSIRQINPGIEATEVERQYKDIHLLLDYEDLGKAFFEKLTARSGPKLIDFQNFDNNQFHVVTELTYQAGDEEFRPDITILINGMPLVFIEVKKPNNKKGLLAEQDRMETRMRNRKLRKFANIIQFMIFSNNMEYDESNSSFVQGAFYAASSYTKPVFNFFREEKPIDLGSFLQPEDDALEDFILKDNNYLSIKGKQEFLTNTDPNRPTNRICTSLLRQERLAFLLNYGLAYVKETSGLQKHIMRYPQMFATQAIARKIDAGLKKGIIWHTQGSGKTALTYFNVKFLTEHFSQKSIIPKFYFIVDRIDLRDQAKGEFEKRGLKVHIVNSKKEFAEDMQKTTALHNQSGQPEITVFNIQKFSEESEAASKPDYTLNIQRVFFLDEAHRSYNPKGNFLANLIESDPKAIKIGLTGTPLISKEYYSKHLFGDYIHKYYYNQSIADGYTLRLLREEIETSYKIMLAKALEELEIQKGDLQSQEVYAHPSFVEPMLDYIIEDFESFRMAKDDAGPGAMVVCHSSEQATALYQLFQKKYAEAVAEPGKEVFAKAAEPRISFRQQHKLSRKVKRAALVLHSHGTKDERKQWATDFREEKIDILFVYNMLLTGFDAKRLKKLYLARIVRRHNLLQTLTRVNRPYKEEKYGYVVDFADIRQEFDATNQAYFEELQEELGDEMEHYSQLFKPNEEIEAEIEEIKDLLFQFEMDDTEVFTNQINGIESAAEMRALIKVLDNAQALRNIIRMKQEYSFLRKLDFIKLAHFLREAKDRLKYILQKEALENKTDNSNLLNLALEDIFFEFNKISEEELVLADEFRETLRKTRESLQNNFDQKDPEFVKLYDELERIFRGQNLGEMSQEAVKTNLHILRKIQQKSRALNQA